MFFWFKTRGTTFRSQLGKIRYSVSWKKILYFIFFCHCFGGFLKSVWVGKRDGFIFLNVLLVLVVNSNSICFSYLSKYILSSKCLMQRTEFFVGNQLFRLTNFIDFSIRSDFPRGKENMETFSLLISYLLEQPNVTHLLTIFC